MVFGVQEFCNVPFQTAISTDLLEENVAQMDAPFRALCDMQHTLSQLINSAHMVLTAPKYDAFVRSLNQCFIGAVKEAPELQLTTSASVGCAYSKPRLSPNNIGIVFNFGTGGGKATIFGTANDGLVVLADIKPRDRAPSPNDAGLPGPTTHFVPPTHYVPKNPKDPKQDARDFDVFLTQVADEIKNIAAVGHVEWIEVFVTGPIREFFFRQSENAKSDMHVALLSYMLPIVEMWLGISLNVHFLAQDQEALYENLACAALYDTLSAQRFIEPSAMVEFGSCGIGRGSCQSFLGIECPVGMNKLEANEVPNTWLFDATLRVLESTTVCDSFVQSVQSIVALGKRPIIAFKSGFALALNDKHLGPLIRNVIVQSKAAIDRRTPLKRARDDSPDDAVRIVTRDETKTSTTDRQTLVRMPDADVQTIERLVEKFVGEQLKRATITFKCVNPDII